MLKFLKSHVVATFAVYGCSVLILAGAFWFAYQHIDPPPPRKVSIATGSKSGAYYRYAKQYVSFFAEQGIELDIIETNGSMDNLSRISMDNGVDAAFMQGGIATPEDYPTLNSLGSLYYEPLWVFYDKKLKIENLSSMKGMKLAIGSEGSGTNYVVKNLLAANDVTDENTTILNSGSQKNLSDLIGDKIDVMFLIAGVKSGIINNLAKFDDELSLLSFNRAEAYTRSHRYLKQLVLPRGALNLAEDLPEKNITLLAPTANLVVREDMHPAIKYLFLLAASNIHEKGDLFSLPSEFPNETALLFPLSSEASSFYKKGPPFLMRYLPYRLAITMERLKILLIPLLTLLYPLFKITPPAYRWQIRRRIFKWYKELKKLDIEAYKITKQADADKMLQELEHLDKLVLETSVPLSYTDHIYSLRIHIRMIQDRLEKLCCEDQDTFV